MHCSLVEPPLTSLSGFPKPTGNPTPLLVRQLPLPTLSPTGGSLSVRLLKRPLALETTVWGGA